MADDHDCQYSPYLEQICEIRKSIGRLPSEIIHAVHLVNGLAGGEHDVGGDLVILIKNGVDVLQEVAPHVPEAAWKVGALERCLMATPAEWMELERLCPYQFGVLRGGGSLLLVGEPLPQPLPSEVSRREDCRRFLLLTAAELVTHLSCHMTGIQDALLKSCKKAALAFLRALVSYVLGGRVPYIDDVVDLAKHMFGPEVIKVTGCNEDPSAAYKVVLGLLDAVIDQDSLAQTTFTLRLPSEIAVRGSRWMQTGSQECPGHSNSPDARLRDTVGQADYRLEMERELAIFRCTWRVQVLHAHAGIVAKSADWSQLRRATDALFFLQGKRRPVSERSVTHERLPTDEPPLAPATARIDGFTRHALALVRELDR